jgi:hypothetical protein
MAIAFTLLRGAAAWPLAARAQQQPKMLSVGFVGIQPREAPVYTNFLKRMVELGYQEGRNFAFDYIQTPDALSEKERAQRRCGVLLLRPNTRSFRSFLPFSKLNQPPSTSTVA